MVRLIDVALLRPGYEEYARERGGRGAATLLKKNVAVEGDKIVVEFKGKGGNQIKQEVEDRSLARVVRDLTALRGPRLFNAPAGNGTKRPITAREVNSFIAQAARTEISAKDFRTFLTAPVLAPNSARPSDLQSPMNEWPPRTLRKPDPRECQNIVR